MKPAENSAKYQYKKTCELERSPITLSFELDLYTPSLKNVPPLACYNFDTREWILISLSAEMLPIKHAIKRCFTVTSNNWYTLLHYPTKRRNKKIAFFTRCIGALPEFNQQLLLDFCNLFSSRLIRCCNQCVHHYYFSWLLGVWFRNKEVDCAAEVGLCCTYNAVAPVRCFMGFMGFMGFPFCKVMLKH